MAIFEPQRYETEEILEIPISSPRFKCFVISGFADFSWGEGGTGGPIGDSPGGSTYDDDQWVTHTLRLVVGREWNDIISVSPTAGIAGYWFRHSDETDATGIELENCRWDTVGAGNSALERIRLNIKLRMCGGSQSTVSKISYHLVAIVKQLGTVG